MNVIPIGPEAGLSLPNLFLIETVLWTGTTAPFWWQHYDRLHKTAARLGWKVPDVISPDEIAAPYVDRMRLKLSLYSDGTASWRVKALSIPTQPWQAIISDRVLDQNNPWLQVSSSYRPVHDAVRQMLPKTIDEAILCNTHGEVCEGTMSNVFFDRGQGIRTPPVSCGLLPGVLRASLAVPEEKLLRSDLAGLKALWLGSALYGLVPVSLQAGP